MMEEITFECVQPLNPFLPLFSLHHNFDFLNTYLTYSSFKLERENVEANDAPDSEVGVGTSKKNRSTSANANALKLTSELLRIFITEAVQRAAATAEVEGASQLEPTHLEIILPQLLLDF
ncbi:hypothetical protein JHK82_047334 [Glycine max]|nr:hypothetical protein JHK86_047228 [Glycine max]KAG4943158.1 hypothetical protein JHK85_047804 [Glycine max]KAG5097480.1 hypothetical protein JHK82_047334 [Glycine max]KAG5102269.1 hypothetical protein JHK84_047238 [Glycine max]